MLHSGLILILIMMMTTGIFQFAVVIAANYEYYDRSLLAGIISTIFGAITDLMICIVFLILTHKS